VAIDRAVLLRNAEKLLRQGKLDQAIAEYRRIVTDHPHDWNTANVLGDLYLRAGQIDKAVEEYTRVADSLSLEGFLSKAIALYKKILKIRPHDEYVLLQAAEIAAGQGLFVDAHAYLNAVSEQRRTRGDVAGVAAIAIRLATLDPADYDARLAGARAQVEIGDIAGAVSGLKSLARALMEESRGDQALAALKEAAQLAPADAEVKIALARILTNRNDQGSADEATALALELSEAAIARGDWTAAVAALQQSLQQSPADIPMLSRLVEVSVDGGLHDIATSAQSRLADAYLTAGSALEARFIAEDLVARHPQEDAHLERLRRALTLLGEADPEAVIAAWLSGLEPIEKDPTEPGLMADVEPTTVEETAELIESSPAMPTSEVDLSVINEDVTPGEMPPQAAPQPPAPRDLDDIFADIREEAAQSFARNNPDQELAAGIAFYRAGQLDLAVPRLEAASRAAATRFAAAATLGRIFLERGDTWRAIEWLERAAETPAPAPSDGHRLLYELADALEGIGEVARALAICLELRAEAGDYQDVAMRVDRLAKVQARG
jgi:tetratricopeptide (TPR) repeat protein